VEEITSVLRGWSQLKTPVRLIGYIHGGWIEASCSILSVTEAELALQIEGQARVTSPFKVLKDAKWHEDDTFDAVFWKAGVLFLSRVFAPSDFTQQPPTFINRHWILHGRAPVDWTLSDALRLVNSLTTDDA
jgi:hypothetical protein